MKKTFFSIKKICFSIVQLSSQIKELQSYNREFKFKSECKFSLNNQNCNSISFSLFVLYCYFSTHFTNEAIVTVKIRAFMIVTYE